MLTISILAIILLLVIAVILIVSLMEKQPLDPNASGVILVDGQCAMCNGFAQFVVAYEPKGTLFIVAQQSDEGKQLLKRHGMPEDLSTVVFIERLSGDKTSAYTKSTAVLRSFRYLSGPFSFLFACIVIPSFIRDTVYDLVAKYRYLMFGKRDSCVLPDKLIRGKINRELPSEFLK